MRIQVDTTDDLLTYLASVSLREPQVLRDLRARTSEIPEHLMQISPEQGQFLNLLVRAIGARRAIEVGVFTGYSLICTALALPSDGTIIGCDVSTEWSKIALEYSERAGVADRVDLRVGDARQTLAELVADGQAATFDFVFIDADKQNYLAYFDAALTLLRSNGLVVLDNVLWHGALIDAAVQDEETRALRAVNERLHHDERVHLSMIPFADGLTLALKR
jgi:caffeoyl-CoA O-methyltransferase